MGELTKKHGLKVLGSWVDMPQHTLYTVFEGSFDDLQKLSMEPEIMGGLSWSTMETKPVLTNAEVSAMLKKAK